ncbi:MAG: GlsB/YeaQ/YmgE family stress response membrane protein [Anaerolineae bacterium]
MDLMNIVIWGVIGALVSVVVILWRQTRPAIAVTLDLILGVIGGIIGGFVLRLLNVIGDAQLTGSIHLPSVLLAVLGAVVVVFVAEAIRGPAE